MDLLTEISKNTLVLLDSNDSSYSKFRLLKNRIRL